jgi:hypothetical protein
MYLPTRYPVVVKWLFLLLIGVSISLSIQAQPATLPENMTRETILKRDTTKGIHHLFRARRIGSSVNIGLGLYQLYGGIQLVNSNAFANSLTKGTYFSDPASRSATFPTQILASLPGALIVGVGISKWIRFKKKKEIDLLAAYESGMPLRADIQRRLRGRHLVSSTPAKAITIPDTLTNTPSVIKDTLISMSGAETDTSVRMPASAPEIMTVASILKGDTVRAIHRLFTSRRGGSTGNILLGVVTVAGGFALAAAVRSASDAVSHHRLVYRSVGQEY